MAESMLRHVSRQQLAGLFRIITCYCSCTGLVPAVGKVATTLFMQHAEEIMGPICIRESATLALISRACVFLVVLPVRNGSLA